ncbi:hypothetical protein [Zavarzinella formosa]|uniref:hypothetical protein n=1 Tax=Zavarzinella formosa TaxID=360055 RepID=UPI00036D0149|nr:hypothetical protein [Zavarzinella formosa]
MPKLSHIYGSASVVLPNPPYPKATLRVIVEAITEAWRLLRDDPQNGFILDGATEDEITLELRNRLMDDVLDSTDFPAFTSENFWINRESKFESFDRKHLDKMPDLHVAVRRNCSPGLRSADGLFVECKPVGRPTPAGEDYCDKGIIRFVSGEYAWAMPHALMVGYAASGYTIVTKLKTALGKRKLELKLDGSLKKCCGSVAKGYAQDLHETTHNRGFTYPQTKTTAPAIVLQHLWLDRE